MLHNPNNPNTQSPSRQPSQADAPTPQRSRRLPRYRDEIESDVFIRSGAEDLVPVLIESDGRWLSLRHHLCCRRKCRFSLEASASFQFGFKNTWQLQVIN
jgi:hypothetical protein